MKTRYLVSSPATLNAALETWFIQNVLLMGLPYTLDSQADEIRNSTVIYLELSDISQSLIAALRSRGNKVILFHMGDELANKDISLYKECDMVIRNYYFQHIFEDLQTSENIFWVPNGFRTGIGPRDETRVRPALERKFFASFMGWLSNAKSHNNERASFQNVIPACSQYLFLNASSGFGGGFNLGLYATIMESSVFCPCPAGNSPETIRLYDALESGAIPISTEHDFMKSPAALFDPPFPLLNNWGELPRFLALQHAKLQSNPSEILSMQASCLEWWRLCKKRISGRIESQIFRIST